MADHLTLGLLDYSSLRWRLGGSQHGGGESVFGDACDSGRLRRGQQGSAAISEQPKFQLINGDWVSAPALLDLPQTVRARAPEDRTKSCRVRVGCADALKAAQARRRQPICDFWSVLQGKVPPVPQTESESAADLTTLYDAHACFKGIRRPADADDVGGRFLAYVLKPRDFYAFRDTPPLAHVSRRRTPADLVFVAYVRLDQPSESGETRGVLTHWHFVEADARDLLLPVDFDKRYQTRVW